MTWQWVCLILGLAWWLPATMFVGYLHAKIKTTNDAGKRVDDLMAKLPNLGL
jgi:hypothetical protein